MVTIFPFGALKTEEWPTLKLMVHTDVNSRMARAMIAMNGAIRNMKNSTNYTKIIVVTLTTLTVTITVIRMVRILKQQEE